jgi:hypothetical protein
MELSTNTFVSPNELVVGWVVRPRGTVNMFSDRVVTKIKRERGLIWVTFKRPYMYRGRLRRETWSTAFPEYDTYNRFEFLGVGGI